MVGTLIVGAAAGVGAAGVAASFALTAAAFAVNFAVSLIVSRVFGQSGQGPQDSGTREQVPPSGSNAIPIVYGDAYLGGTFVDAVLSNDQKIMYYVMAVSCVSPNGQFAFDTGDMWYGDRKITFDGADQAKVVSLTDQAGNVDNKINGSLWIYLYRSSASGTITPLNSSYLPSSSVLMGATTINPALRWPADGRQMNGLAFAVVQLHYNQDAGTTSLSPITFKAKHYLNGTGVAKPGDVWYDYITNKQYGGAVGWLPDGTFSPNFVNTASVTALNAYSDQTITYEPSGGGSATQARYRMNGVLDAGQTVLSNLDKIMTSADSWMAYNAALGQWSIVINKAETTSFAFDDDNIIGEVRVSATDITQSINQVEAKFPDKGARDQPNFVNLKTPPLLRYPNEPDNKYSVTYDLCNDSVQAQYLANRILEQAREDLIVSFSTTYYGIQVDAGDVVSVTNADYGWNNKLFRVVKVNEASLPDGSLGAKLEMSEYSAAVYDDFNITQYTPVPNSGLPNVGYFSNLTAPTVTGFPTVSVPYFNVVASIPATGRVTFVDLFYATTPTPTASDLKLLFTATSSNSQPFTNSSSFTFGNQILPSGTYYFGYVVGNELGQSTISALSTPFAWSPTGTVGPFVDISGVTTFSKTSSNVYTPPTATLNAVTQSITSPTYAWVITGATPTSSVLSSVTITPNAAATSVTAQLTVNGTNLTAPIVKTVTMGIIVQAEKYATANLYQWATATPGNPSGTSTYTWATGANSSYTGVNGWSVTVPTNPGTAGLLLFVATKQVVDNPAATTTTVSWTSGFSIQTGAENGANGVQVNTAIVYRWATTIPTISGTSTYTWATGAVTSPPTNWFTTISDTGTAGQTLWAAKVDLTDSVTALTSTVNWATASIVPFGYSGSTGAVSRIAYTATNLTLDSSPSVYVVAGDSLPELNSWSGTPIKIVRAASTANITTLSGLLTVDGIVLAANDRVLVKNQTASQNNGIYVVSASTWTRSTDANTWNEFIGLRVFVSSGTANANTYWLSNAVAGGTLGTTPIAFTSTSITPVAWSTEIPTLTTGQQVWQSDGIFNPTNDETIWETPYLSSLKVGNLSAISTNTGSLTVSGNVTIGNYGNIRGGQTAYNVGTGFFLGYSATTYKFSIGSIKVGNANVSTNAITSASHQYTNNTQIVFTGVGSVTGIVANKIYYVVNVTTDTFQVSTSISGAAIDLTGTTSNVSFTSQSLYWDGSALTFSGNMLGGTIRIGSGNTTNGNAFEVTSGGVVRVDNIFGGIGYFSNSNLDTEGCQGWSFNSRNYPGSAGYTAAGNAAGNAHGLRGQNFQTGAAGLVGGANNYDFYADGSGTNYGPFTGNHDILVPVGQTLSEGSLVVDVQCVARKGWSNAVFEVAQSSSANQAGCRGVFIGSLVPLSQVKPAVFIESTEVVDGKVVVTMTEQYEQIKDQYLFGSMSALGEGQIQVCGEAGNISVDTLLVTSNTAGVAMAQADNVIRGGTVAKAREAVVFASSTEVKTVACIYLGG